MKSWRAALSGTSPWEVASGAGSGAKGLVEGQAEGILYGGCLSILAASLGTRYEIDTEGKIFLLRTSPPSRIKFDRMLVQLKLAGKLNGVKGIVFGEMCDCVQTANQGYTLEETPCALSAIQAFPGRRPALRPRDYRKYHFAIWSHG